MHETIIIGAGIAGMTAAIYASRKRMDYMLLSGPEFGGQFLVSGEVLNYPGIPETTGVDFLSTMQVQLEKNNIKPIEETVLEIIPEGDNYKVKTDKGEHLTQTVIIGTGARARKLEVEGEDRFAKHGLTYCSVCDGPLFKDKEVVIVGGGNSALEAVDFMKNIASKIHMIVLNDSLKGHEYLLEKVKDNDKVEIHYNSRTTEVFGDKFVEGIKFLQKSENGEQEKELKVQGVIIEIGRIPNTDFVKNLLDVDEHKHIVTDCQAHTSRPGIFAAGDVASGHEYQYVIAAGQGCISLLKAARYIANRKGQ